MTFKNDHRLYYYRAVVVDVTDGDTTVVDLDLGLGLWSRDRAVRWYGIDAPEKSGETRAAGLASLAAAEGLLEVGSDVLLRTFLDKRQRDETGRYGRLLGEFHAEVDGRQRILNEVMVTRGHALVRTYGQPLPPWAVGLPRHPADTRPRRRRRSG